MLTKEEKIEFLKEVEARCNMPLVFNGGLFEAWKGGCNAVFQVASELLDAPSPTKGMDKGKVKKILTGEEKEPDEKPE